MAQVALTRRLSAAHHTHHTKSQICHVVEHVLSQIVKRSHLFALDSCFRYVTMIG